MFSCLLQSVTSVGLFSGVSYTQRQTLVSNFVSPERSGECWFVFLSVLHCVVNVRLCPFVAYTECPVLVSI